MRTPLAIAAVLALGACAGTETPTTAAMSDGSYAQERADLERQCDSRTGILVPSGSLTGNPRTDYVCKIHGGPSDLIQPNR
jgi:hypothetical protein